MRPKRTDPTPNGHDANAMASILAQVPTAQTLEDRLAGLELEAARVRTLLAAVRQMSGSRQPLAEPFNALAAIDETA
jgi:hypothetical protein